MAFSVFLRGCLAPLSLPCVMARGVNDLQVGNLELCPDPSQIWRLVNYFFPLQIWNLQIPKNLEELHRIPKNPEELAFNGC